MSVSSCACNHHFCFQTVNPAQQRQRQNFSSSSRSSFGRVGRRRRLRSAALLWWWTISAPGKRAVKRGAESGRSCPHSSASKFLNRKFRFSSPRRRARNLQVQISGPGSFRGSGEKFNGHFLLRIVASAGLL